MFQAPLAANRTGPLVITVLALLLLILHQDYWLWDDQRLVFGILPIGLLWHVCISIAAASIWFLATRLAWPLGRECEIDGSESEPVGKGGQA